VERLPSCAQQASQKVQAVYRYAICWRLDLGALVAAVARAALTATSVGITVRVLSTINFLVMHLEKIYFLYIFIR
jgi:hypothetical protein